MSNIIRIKRRLDEVGALSGAPASLYNAEMAFNEVDNTLYYGRGDNGSGMATDIIKIGGNGYVESLVSSASSKIMHTISDNLSTVLGTDIASLAEDLNSIQELAQSLSGDAHFAVTVNDRLNTLQNSLTSSSGSLGGRVSSLESGFQTLTGANQISVLGSIASQDSDDVNITGGTISVSTLTVTGDSSVANLSASGALSVEGAASLKSSLEVTGVTTLKDALNVDGAVDLNSTLNVDGAATLNGGATITGAASVTETLTVTGSAILNGGAAITGSATVSETLTVTGSAILNGGVDVSNLHVSGNADIDGTLNVDSKATLSSLEVTNNADVKGNATVDGNLTVGSGSTTLFVGEGVVGINTENPSEALDVLGNAKVSGNITGTEGVSILSGFLMDGGLF